MTTTTACKSFYAMTYITQNENHSRSHQDFCFVGKEPTREELIQHLCDVLDGGILENENENWEENDEEQFVYPELFGMSSYEFATYLFDNAGEAEEKYGTTATISWFSGVPMWKIGKRVMLRGNPLAIRD